MLQRLKDWAEHLARDVLALSLAMSDKRVPWYAKAVAFFVVAYALSPIDLIPDFIPVLGYLDDLILLPIGIWVVLKLIPDDLMAELRAEAEGMAHRQLPKNVIGAVIIVAFWGLILYALMSSLGIGQPPQAPLT
ncbi:MAG: YkvA family protein [Alphaproteobacteria bacterium]